MTTSEEQFHEELVAMVSQGQRDDGSARDLRASEPPSSGTLVAWVGTFETMAMGGFPRKPQATGEKSADELGGAQSPVRTSLKGLNHWNWVTVKSNCIMIMRLVQFSNQRGHPSTTREMPANWDTTE